MLVGARCKPHTFGHSCSHVASSQNRAGRTPSLCRHNKRSATGNGHSLPPKLAAANAYKRPWTCSGIATRQRDCLCHRHEPWRLTACPDLGKQIFSFVVFVAIIVMLFICRHNGIFEWTVRLSFELAPLDGLSLTSGQATPKRSASDAADATMHFAKAGTYDLCAAFTHRDFWYPIVAFILFDSSSSGLLALSFICLAVSVSHGNKHVTEPSSKISRGTQTLGLCTAAVSFPFTIVVYLVSLVHLQGGQLTTGYSVILGAVNFVLSSLALGVAYIYDLLQANNPFSDRHALGSRSQLSEWPTQERH